MRWNYKTEHFSLKKEGLLGSAFLDEAEIELSLNEFGKAGWELVSIMEVNDGVIAIFKQPFNQDMSYKNIQKEDKGLAVETVVTEAQQGTVINEKSVASTDQSDEDLGDIKIF